MVYKKVPSDYGLYKATDGSLYDIMEATNVMTPQGKNYLWDEFKNIYEAAKTYGLMYIEPEPEEPEKKPIDSLTMMIQDILKEEVNS